MKLLSKTALLAAGAATLIASTPAMARDHRGHRDGIDAGDVIAGALIIGGIAAIATAASNGGNRNGRSYASYDDGRRGYGDRSDYRDNGYGSRAAVDQCVRAAQRDASRYGWARVTDVSSIDRVRGGYEVRGRIVVEDRGNDRRGYNQRGWGRGGHDRGYNYDRYSDGYDKGRFSCTTRHGRIDDVNLSGLRGGYYR
jgi:hypothetical protein